jgi:hypothetical protein
MTPSPPLSRARETLRNSLLSLASLLVLFLVLEAGLRVFGFVPDRFLMMGRMANARWTLLLDCYPTNPRGYFDIDLRSPPNRERYFSVAPLRYDLVAHRAPWAVESRYNALRFRDAPLGPKSPGVRRVMVLGDSFTEGQGVKEPDTCVRQLEGLLNATEPGKWEVRNCGRRGTDFPALYDAFEAILPYEPDILVYAMVLNDPDQSESFHARQTYVNDWILDRGRQTDELEAGPGPFRSRLFTLFADRVAAGRVGRATTRWYLDMYGPPNREGWERTQDYIREMNRRVRERGGQFLVAPWPLFVGLDGGYPFAPIHETIRRFCLQTGIAHHDLLPVFLGRYSETLWVHPVDRHPNELAHRLAAEDLAPLLRGLGRGSSP